MIHEEDCLCPAGHKHTPRQKKGHRSMDRIDKLIQRLSKKPPNDHVQMESLLEGFPPEERRQWELLWEGVQRRFGGQIESPEDAQYSPSAGSMRPYLWGWNAGTNLITILPSLIQDLGYFEHDTGVTFDGWDRMVHPDDLPHVVEAFDARRKGQSEAFAATHRIRTASGRWYPVTVREIEAVIGLDGRPVDLKGVFIPEVDSSPEQWMRDQEALSESPSVESIRATDLFKILDFLGSTNSYHVFIMDTKLRYSWMNDLLQIQLDCPLSKALGRTDRELFGRISDKRLEEACRKALQGSAARAMFTWPIGSELNAFDGLFVAHRDSNGDPICLYGICSIFLAIEAMSDLANYQDLGVRSTAMIETLAAAETVANSDSTVLLLGETGSGKDWLSQYIHDHSAALVVRSSR